MKNFYPLKTAVVLAVTVGGARAFAQEAAQAPQHATAQNEAVVQARVQQQPIENNFCEGPWVYHQMVATGSEVKPEYSDYAEDSKISAGETNPEKMCEEYKVKYNKQGGEYGNIISSRPSGFSDQRGIWIDFKFHNQTRYLCNVERPKFEPGPIMLSARNSPAPEGVGPKTCLTCNQIANQENILNRDNTNPQAMDKVRCLAQNIRNLIVTRVRGGQGLSAGFKIVKVPGSPIDENLQKEFALFVCDVKSNADENKRSLATSDLDTFRDLMKLTGTSCPELN
ncbi:MAG: hypothetical protein C5B49_04805 [Bdellovibrio sp.]|nr:MAG: hypothetical protein C5B49_04805 [Bdellovibrio sp.]